jgi:UDP-N-acetyl-D-glucosamine dehydrogenase
MSTSAEAVRQPTPLRTASATPRRWRSTLARRIERREATVGVVGMGYVGLPLLLAVGEAGFPVVGVDRDGDKVRAVRSAHSYLTDVSGERLAALKGARFSTRSALLRDCDVVIICVPTPLRNHEPDLSAIESGARSVSRHLHPGMLVVLESTTYPGTTEEVVQPILEASAYMAGKDFALAYAPERIDPGHDQEYIVDTPRVVGGLTPRCTELAALFYGSVVRQVHTVSSPREAEMAKLIENTFRHVNIGLINELAIVSRDLGVDIWESIEAAATKPFGFMPFWPGPGVGGHCIAIDPSYLSWRVGQQLGYRMTFVEHAQQVNARMPAYVVSRIAEALNEHGKPLRGSRILGLGVAYKPDVPDSRESPAMAVLNRLARSGAEVTYHDPFISEAIIAGKRLTSAPLDAEVLGTQDCVVILTTHSDVDYEALLEAAPLVFDTRGIREGVEAANMIRL